MFKEKQDGFHRQTIQSMLSRHYPWFAEVNGIGLAGEEPEPVQSYLSVQDGNGLMWP